MRNKLNYYYYYYYYGSNLCILFKMFPITLKLRHYGSTLSMTIILIH
jgi:hypothetical protein